MPPFFDVHGDPTMDPYTILSLPPTASEAEIKKAYRMQMLQLHPDKLASTLGENSIADVTEKFHNVKDAYEFLMSPMHLTSRRLYMAKMASRRAEYERREAFLRRNGGMDNANAGGTAGYSTYTSQAGVSGYASGGGGAAGMAGTGMRGQPGNSYAMPPSRKNNDLHRSKSEPVFQGKQGGGNRRNNRMGGHQQQRYSNKTAGEPQARGRSSAGDNRRHDSKPKVAKSSRRERGYKSDSNATKTNKTSPRAGRSSKPHSSRNKEKQQQRQQRTKSESRGDKRDKHYYESSGSERKNGSGSGKARKSRDRGRDTTAREQQHQQQKMSDKEKRRRARSAPARYSSKQKSSNSKDYGRNSPSTANSVPKEFLCPLTKRLMKDPVKDTEGNTYEREAIERWLRVQSSSPITNGFLSMDMIRPDREMKRAIYKVTGKPRSKSQTRRKTRSTSPTEELVSGRVLVDSYLREISSKSKLSVSLDGMGVCAFSYRRITFVIEVPITPHAGFMVYSSFDGESKKNKLAEKMEAWNTWLSNIGWHSEVSYLRAGHKTVFTLKGSENDMSKCDVFQKTLEYFVTMSLKLHNLLHPMETRAVENVSLTRLPVVVA